LFLEGAVIDPISIQDVASGTVYGLPPFVLRDVRVDPRLAVSPYLRNSYLVVADIDPETHRSTAAQVLTLEWPALVDRTLPGMTRDRLRSLLMAWLHGRNTLKITGINALQLNQEPLLCWQVGAVTQASSSEPYWAASPVVQVNGVTQSSSSYTANLARGYVTFNTLLSAGSLVTVTVARQPVVQVDSLPTLTPLLGVYPVSWSVAAEFKEVKP
jgi:hypothetical protein